VPAPRPAIREPDPDEEDELLTALDQANAAAAKATAPPPEADRAADQGGDAGSSDEKTVG
jgi:hypothetical protein